MDPQTIIEVGQYPDVDEVAGRLAEASMEDLQQAWAYIDSLPEELFNDRYIQRSLENISKEVTRRR